MIDDGSMIKLMIDWLLMADWFNDDWFIIEWLMIDWWLMDNWLMIECLVNIYWIMIDLSLMID